MARRKTPLAQMLVELTVASWQTMAYRMGMMALGTCSAAEYRRMATEKVAAAQQSALAAMLPGRNREAAILAPWRRAATSNARRLRRRKS